MSPNPNFLRFPHSNIDLSHVPKWNTFVPYISTKPQTHSSLTQPGRFQPFRVIAPKARCQLRPLFAKRVGVLASILPGGRWWALPELREDGSEPTAAVIALRRMWELVADERRVAFVAVGSLVIAAVILTVICRLVLRGVNELKTLMDQLSEISMPSILAASIFSAQSGETVAFSRNALFLLLLCLTSGTCSIKTEWAIILFSHLNFSGLRSGCFGILNVTLVKRLRENLYTAILFQDVSYFDKERVGDLTSRLAADCQRLSHVVGNDLQLILRNTCQGAGAILNLMALSWPLALSALVICSILSAIFLVYGQYQRKAAKLIQDFTACANDVAQETLYSIRTVRAYGTEKREFERYRQWLQTLAFINVRENVASGFWNLIFNTLYRSTQIFAVLLVGMSVLRCRVTVEQLTKYVLYCEWLIYATWRVTNSLTSLLQSIGASEQIFQLMNLLPSDQFIAKGKGLFGSAHQTKHFDTPILTYCRSEVTEVGRAYSVCKCIISLSCKEYAKGLKIWISDGVNLHYLKTAPCHPSKILITWHALNDETLSVKFDIYGP
ncbi:unnamed protein product [Sphenostylis stenocarpa]|uniref:ABC transmembrane type-1 domain-containing protein n=1 Tax=Sphenostylis stenocarpa TaxID=92480 RepID=A0AA86RKE1_9FABA|nr:unnamed protein product [Sphenostylis stenocarpa]